MNKYLIEAERLLLARRFLEAATACKKAMRKPEDLVRARRLLADCYYNQGVMDVFGSGLLDDAEKHFRLALEQHGQHADALNNLAALLSEQGRLDDAIALLHKLIAIAPARLNGYRDLAVVYQRMDYLDEASAVLEKLAALMPQDGSARLRQALLVKSIVPNADYPAEVRQRIADQLATIETSGRSITDPAWFPGTYFYLSYHGRCNKDLHQRIAATHLRAAPSLAWQAPALRPKHQAHIRIGLASTSFFNHSIGHTSRGFVEQIDRDRFEVVLIRLGNTPADDIAKAIDQAADRVVHVPLSSLQAAREQIAALELDILFWQDIGMEPFSYLLAFARLAPVQLTSFGHPDTTGIPNIDYFLSSEHYETTASDTHYSERLICIPGAGTLAYYHRPTKPTAAPERDRHGIVADDHVYLCPQTLFKLHPDMDEVFLSILARDARAKIILIDPGKGRMRALLEERLARRSPLLAERVVFVKRLDHADYLSLILCADVVLDTLHFNGQNTSLESLALGVPIVTLPGELHRSRHTYAMYRAMNFMDLVAADKTDYVAKALAVANDQDFAAHCRARIEATASVLYENRDFIRHCEDAFVAMLAERHFSRSSSKVI